MTPLKTKKITMVIEVVPSPRLDVICEPGNKMPDVRGPVDDGLLFEPLDHSIGNVEVPCSSLAFDVSPEDLFLLDCEAMKSLLSGSPQAVVVDFASQRADAASDRKRDAEQQDHTKVRLTFIPIFQHAEFVHNGIGREENNRHYDSDCDTISERLPKKLKKGFHEAVKAHRR